MEGWRRGEGKDNSEVTEGDVDEVKVRRYTCT